MLPLNNRPNKMILHLSNKEFPVKLFLTPRSCSMAVDIVAREAKIPLDLVWVDVRNKKLMDGGDYYKVNPKGQVPALQTDSGEYLTEGGVIIQYILDATPGNTLLPRELGLHRYRVLEWLSFISAELHKGFTPLFRPTTPPEYRAIAVENLNKRFAWLDEVLAEQQFLCGDAFTAADAYCFTIVKWSDMHKVDISSWPHLVAYLDRVEQRPAVQAALETERKQLEA
ncbi:glutathione transferase GstA [Hwanghaeella sp. LZ110]|uniref:glutathione transferase GstA n=1 Tax=Hwanghaeella sp. LZ110 TaxID=3402810 RepID=UPI003B66B0D5